MDMTVLPADVKTLRQLAARVREIAGCSENLARKERWLRHNALQSSEPMILIEVGGLEANSESPITALLSCQESWARELEKSLRSSIYDFETVGADWVVEPFLNCHWRMRNSDYGVSTTSHSGSHDGTLGSYVWEAPIRNLREDLDRLKPRTFAVDRDATAQHQRLLEETLGDILPVRIRGGFWWTCGLTQLAIKLIGLEQLMLYMVDDPQGLHRLMQFLHDDHLAYLTFLQHEGLLSLNNENDYIGSGSVGYTHQLPQPGMGSIPRAQDLWCLSESQETVGVGPEMFAEFIFPYQKSLAERFGLTYYGCCEPVHNRWHILKALANLRKVSVSPWCDEAFMARELAGRYVYCRKPNPSLISTERFDEAAIRQDLRCTLAQTRKHGCIVEIVMKDVHTVQRQPQRLARWVQIAREECRST